MFATAKYETQDAMIESGRTPDELIALAAKGQAVSYLLDWALEKPPKNEEE
jgi:hypothetical protein